MADSPGRTGFTDDELETWSAVATMLEWLPSALDAQLQRDAGITHFEYGILFALDQAPDRTLRMSTLARFSNSSLSRLSRAVARLERKGWVDRAADPTDGRYTLASLTADGVRQAVQATPGHVETVRALVLDFLTTGQTRQLREISQRVLKAISADEGWRPPSPTDSSGGGAS